MHIHSLRFIPAFAGLLAITTPAPAQEQPVAFTAAQAERGHAAYRSNCQDCHGSELDNGEFGGPPLKGGYFRGRWGSGNASVLFGMLSLTMPPDRPGQLTPQTYADLLAFILSNNGYPPRRQGVPFRSRRAAADDAEAISVPACLTLRCSRRSCGSLPWW